MKVAAFLALGLAVADAQVQECLTQNQINQLSNVQLAALSSPVGAQQAALAELLQLYGIYGNQQFNLNTATGSCASRCVTGSATIGRNSLLGLNTVGCVPSFTSGGITYTYTDTGYVSSSNTIGRSTFNTFGTGCQCDQDCSARGDCCVDYRTSCGLANGNRYAYQIIETVEVPVPVPVNYIVEVPVGSPVPVNNPVGIPVGRPFPVPVFVDVNQPVPVNMPVNVPIGVNQPFNSPVPVGRPVNVPVGFAQPVGNPVTVPVNIPVTVNQPVNQPVNVPVNAPFNEVVPFGQTVLYPVNSPVNIPVNVAFNVPQFINVPVNIPVPVNVPNRIQVPYGVPNEVQVFRDVAVPVPVPIYVNNPIPIDQIRNVIQDINVPVNQPVLVPVDVPVGVNTPVPFNVNEPVNAPFSINVPYTVVEEVQVPVNVPVGVPVRVENIVVIPYTVNNPVVVSVPRIVEIIEFVNNPVPVEVQRAVGQVSVPVYLGYTETGVWTGGAVELPVGQTTGKQTNVIAPDISGITSFQNEAVIVDTFRGNTNQGIITTPQATPARVGAQCTPTSQVFQGFVCINNVWTSTIVNRGVIAGAQCTGNAVSGNFVCINSVWTSTTVNRGVTTTQGCTPGTTATQGNDRFTCNAAGQWRVANTVVTVATVAPPNPNLLLVQGR
jgi:hypothetical protein